MVMRIVHRAVVVALVVAGVTGATTRTADAVGPCKASETRAVALAFVRAWTRGDVAAVDRLVAPEPHFRWVSAPPPGGRSGTRAFDRPSLGAYIRARHAQHERLTL